MTDCKNPAKIPQAVTRVPRVVFWGTYDVGKPRVRLLLAGARTAGLDVLECHEHVWAGIEDKSQVHGIGSRLGLLGRWVRAYPTLILRYVRLPEHDAVIVGYPGVFDVLVLWPLAWIRGTPILWDVFLSLYDTLVRDRRLLSPWSPLAWGVYALEWLAARAATRPFLDTRAHARYFARLFHLNANRISAIPVGTEEDAFPAPPNGQPLPKDPGTFTVLFYGQFIPLHGLDVVIDAAALVARETRNVRWVIIGRGQEAGRIDARLASMAASTVTRIDWVAYTDLARWIRQADVCLGIFGTSEKAGNVIPNKVYQVLAMARPVITSDTPAQRELLEYGAEHLITFVPPGDSVALANAVLRLWRSGPQSERRPTIVGLDEVGRRLEETINEVRQPVRVA
jgi:glycosyltransferase involved in cell wall biosynthesis